MKRGFKGVDIIPLDRNQVLKRFPKTKTSDSTAADNGKSSYNENHSLLVNSMKLTMRRQGKR